MSQALTQVIRSFSSTIRQHAHFANIIELTILTCGYNGGIIGANFLNSSLPLESSKTRVCDRVMSRVGNRRVEDHTGQPTSCRAVWPVGCETCRSEASVDRSTLAMSEKDLNVLKAQLEWIYLLNL